VLRKGHILVILVIAVSFVTVNEAYGITLEKFLIPLEDKKPAGSDRMDWGIIFVTSFNDCSDRNWQALNFYSYIAIQSIQQYGYPNAIIFADCVSKNDYLGHIKQYQDYMDLPIFVLDYRLSMTQRHSANELGHYSYYNAKNIVTQAKTFSIENQDTAWTLSHEIAHSSLDWLGYVKYDNVGYKWNDGVVHKIQVAYNKCKINDITLSSCQQLWNAVRTPDGKYYPIMSVNFVLDIITDFELKEQKKLEDEADFQNLQYEKAKKLQEEKLRDLADLEKRIEDHEDRFVVAVSTTNAENYEECLAFAVGDVRTSCDYLRPDDYPIGLEIGDTFSNWSTNAENVINCKSKNSCGFLTYQPKTDYVEPEKTDEQQAYLDAQEQFKFNRQLKQWEDERKLKLENNPIPEPSDFVLVDPKETKETQKPAEPDYFSDFIIQIQDFFSSLRWG